MMQAVHHQYPDTNTTWAFKCRDDEDLLPYIDEIQDQVNMLNDLQLTDKEEAGLKNIRYFKPDFIRFLKLFRFDPSYVEIDEVDGKLSIRTHHSPYVHVILYETVIMAIISEIRNKALYPNVMVVDALIQLEKEFKHINDTWDSKYIDKFNLADFGTRRRFSYNVQSAVIDHMIEYFPGNFVGTSNVHFAIEKGITPIGTMAHEWAMAHQQLGGRLADSQKAMLDAWVNEYRGDLGIALTDCITTKAFLKDFDLFHAKLYDGLRHDSGSPFTFIDDCVDHYHKLRIDPMTKTLTFSDGLNFDKCYDIMQYCDGKIKDAYGMGTFLTCNIPGVKPLNMVMKMIECNGQPVAKISDSQGKTMCEDEQYVQYLKSVFNV